MHLLGARALSLVAGLLAATSVLVLGVSGVALRGDVLESAVPEVVVTEQVHGPLVDVLADAVADLVPPGALDPSAARRAAERALDDPDLIEVVGVALATAHDDWRAGAPAVVRIAPGPATAPIVGGLRDVDADLARRVPPGTVARIGPATVDVPAAADVRRVRDLARLGLVATGVLAVAAVAAPGDRPRTLVRLGRLAVAVGFGGVAVGLVAPVARDLGADGSWGPALALVAADRSRWIVLGVVVVVLGLSAAVVGRHVVPAVRRARRAWAERRSLDAPAPTGAVRRATPAARQAALAAFFADEPAAEPERDPTWREDELVEEAPPFEPSGTAAVVAAETDPEAEARAAARDADRRDAMARIDGTSPSRLRTHLRR